MPSILDSYSSSILRPDATGAQERGQLRVPCYRIVQEALNNVAKHGAASRAIDDLDFGPEQVVLCIQDGRHGLIPRLFRGMDWACRIWPIGAEFPLQSRPGHATQIEFVCRGWWRWQPWMSKDESTS